MPLYEYQCESCSHRFEVIQKFSDPPVETCTKCGGTVKKLLSSPAIQFKGSGWYITDYARKGSTGSTGSTDSTGSNGSGSAGSDSTRSTSDATSSTSSPSNSDATKPSSS